MKSSTPMKSVLLPGLVASTVFLASCGGGSSDSDSSVNSRGPVTGFGSVYVNGVKYGTDDARFIIDDSNASQSELRVGMIVTVSGEIDDNGKTGRATRIAYENELKGPISAIVADPLVLIKTLTVLGQQVEVNANTTFDDDHGFNFETMVVGDVVEVSGFNTQTGLTATHMEKQDDDSDIEILGEIANLDESAGTFDINGFDIAYDSNTEIDNGLTLADGLYVEVEGILDVAGTTLLAEEIELEIRGLGDNADEAEVQGVISNYDSNNQTFEIQGQVIDASVAVFLPSSLTLADGLTVEAEGTLIGGILFADKVKQKGQKIKIEAPLSAVNAAGTITFTFNATDIVVRVNQQTELEDDLSSAPLTLSALSTGDYVEMGAFNDGSGDINAVKLKRKTLDEIEIEAPLESFDEAGESVTLLGINFDLSSSSYEDDDGFIISASQFYEALSVGVFIELKDTNNNGVIDQTQLDD